MTAKVLSDAVERLAAIRKHCIIIMQCQDAAGSYVGATGPDLYVGATGADLIWLLQQHDAQSKALAAAVASIAALLSWCDDHCAYPDSKYMCRHCGADGDTEGEDVKHVSGCPWASDHPGTALLARIAELEARQRTPGTVERCLRCKLQDGLDLYDGNERCWATCENEDCPITADTPAGAPS